MSWFLFVNFKFSMFPLLKPLGGTDYWNMKLLLVPAWSIFPIHMAYKNPLGMHTVPPANLFTVDNRERRFYLGANLMHLNVAFPSNKWHRILSVSSGKLRERRLSARVKGNKTGVMVAELLFLSWWNNAITKGRKSSSAMSMAYITIEVV